jgi:hypothetical protein
MTNFTKGQRVTAHLTNRDVGRIEFAGTVQDSYQSGRQFIVVVKCDDGVERFPLAENVTPDGAATTASNLMTHTGAVHAPGRTWKALGGNVGPKCAASASAVARWHFVIPTATPVTCKRCLAAQAKDAA